jgi:hypothetical protein
VTLKANTGAASSPGRPLSGTSDGDGWSRSVSNPGRGGGVHVAVSGPIASAIGGAIGLGEVAETI